MAKKTDGDLSRRERQIMDVIYRRGEASVAEVLHDLPNPPSYSAVRALMRILEDKGHLKHKKQGAKYIYVPRKSQRTASKSAIKRVLNTFFGGSVEQAVAALVHGSDTKLSREELNRMADLIEQAKKQER